MEDTRRAVKRLLGALLLGAAGGALLGALTGLILSDLLAWWDRGVVIAAMIGLGALAGIGASLMGEDAESSEDER